MTFLIYSKCNVNMFNVDGQTALHLACQVSSRWPFQFPSILSRNRRSFYVVTINLLYVQGCRHDFQSEGAL
jgi:ankyrin repeat protein